jgi:hypothetical protein
MVLSHLTQKELDRSVDLLVTNGPLPHVQKVIAPVGFGPDGLQRLANLLYGWRAGQTSASMKMLAQKQTRQQRDELRALVEQLVSSFTRTARAVFKDEADVLRALDLRLPRSSKNGSAGNGAAGVEPNDNGAGGVENDGSDSTSPQKPKRAGSLTTCVTDARKLFAKAVSLAEVYKQRLAEVGWDAERLAEAAGQVEALAAIDGKRKDAAAARRNQQAAAMQTERKLRGNYKEARELIRVAIDEADLDNEEEFKQLIGL